MSKLFSAFSWSPVFSDNHHLRQVIDGMEVLDKSEVFFLIGGPFFVKNGNRLQRVNFFEEDSTLGSLEEDQREIIAEIVKIYRENAGEPSHESIRERVDVFFELNGGYFRALVESCRAGTNLRVEIRRIRNNLFSLKGLGYPDSIFQKLLEFTSGLIFVVSPPEGEARTAALSLVHEIASLKEATAVCFEDSLSSLVLSKKTMIVQKTLGFDFTSWDSVKDEASSPSSVVYISDINSKEKGWTALYIALSGKLVVVSMISGSVTEAFQKLEGFFPPLERNFMRAQLSSVFRALIYQNFVPRKDSMNRRVLTFSAVFSSPRVCTLLMEGKYKQLDSESLSAPGVSYISSLKFLYRKGFISEDSFVSEQRRYYGYVDKGGEDRP